MKTRLSAYKQKVGTFYFDATPMVLPGTICCTKKNQSATWNKHGVAGSYIVPALEHYRCYRKMLTEKKSKCIANIAPQNVKMAKVLSADSAKLSARNLIESF